MEPLVSVALNCAVCPGNRTVEPGAMIGIGTRLLVVHPEMKIVMKRKPLDGRIRPPTRFNSSLPSLN